MRGRPGTPWGPTRDRGVPKPSIESSDSSGTLVLVRELSPPRRTSVGMGSSLPRGSRRTATPTAREKAEDLPAVRDPGAGGRHVRPSAEPLRSDTDSDPRGGTQSLSIGGRSHFSDPSAQRGITSWGARHICRGRTDLCWLRDRNMSPKIVT